MAQSQLQQQTSRTAGRDTTASEQLQAKVMELQAAYHEAKMSAAHHKLQYQMLAQESAAAMERLAVEARMTQSENEVLYHAEQSRAAAATPTHTMHGTIMPIQQQEWYHRMCREMQLLAEANQDLHAECRRQNRIIEHQETEIASLDDKVTLLRERIRESREHMQHKLRRANAMSTTPPRRQTGLRPQPQPQRFEALLQASEMASQESARGVPSASGRKGHQRNIHSMSSLPATPQRMPPPSYHTPHDRRPPPRIPATAPMLRTVGVSRTPDVYTKKSLPIPHSQGPPSDGTVSASENDDNDDDSEAETDIIEPEDHVGESFASHTATQMLRTSQQQAKRDSFKGSGMLHQSQDRPLKQTKLFGAVRKANIERDQEERPLKRSRIDDEPALVGLGIAGVRH